ncbi:MAG: Na+/H+ antiporter NhaA [Bacteroidales bacterium]|nr:Na+/H+ antiporter NhaA [Bacteroidales bacterium]
MVKKYVSSSAVLVVFSLLALVCANSPLKEWYFDIWNTPVALSVGNFNLFSHNGHAMSLIAVINDFLMALFFLTVGLEIKREILVGELSSRQKAMLPIVGACGGMLVPVLLFWLICPDDADMLRGMAIPMATDIAFSLGVLSLFGTRVPIGLKIFLAALAVADDLGGIIVIALFYSSQIDFTYLLFALFCVALLIVGNVRRVGKKSYYLAVGMLLWYAMLNSGIHATIAGVIVAFCVPASLRRGSAYYIERIRANISILPAHEVAGKHHTVVLTHDEIHTLKSIESAADKLISPLQDLEDGMNSFIGYVVIPLFAFANVGIDLAGMTIGTLFTGVGLPVMAGLVVGKFVGVFSFSWVAIKCGLVSLPKGSNWRSFASVCMLCGIGLTVSIFIADLSYAALSGGASVLGQAKLGILCGSLVSALLGIFLLNRYLPKNIK